MGSARTSKCSNCGANLRVHPGDTRALCTYCGVDNDLLPPPGPPPPLPRFDGPSNARRDARSPSGSRVSVAAILVVLLCVGAGVVWFAARTRSAPVADVQSSPPVVSSPALEPRTSASPSASKYAGIPRGPAGFQWVDQYASVVGVDANGDGVEDLAGPFVLESEGKLDVWVGVLDGTDFHLLWKAGPFGIRAKATRKTGVAVGKGRMVAVEVKGLAHLYDLRTGEELGVFPYSQDDSRGLCAIPADEGGVYIGDPGGRGARIDLTTGKTSPVASPAGCGYRAPRRPRDSGDPTQELVAVLPVPAPDGFDWHGAPLSDGVDAVGVATPKGDEGFVLVGLDAKTRAIRWQQSATAVFGKTVERVGVDRVGGGVAYVQLPWELAAVDARTGHVRWSDPGVTAGGQITLTPTRLYCAGLGWDGMPVNVFDVATGKLLARLGHSRED